MLANRATLFREIRKGPHKRRGRSWSYFIEKGTLIQKVKEVSFFEEVNETSKWSSVPLRGEGHRGHEIK